MMVRLILFSILTILLLPHTAMTQTRSVLFIGNSYTYFNDLPATIGAIAQSKGDTLLWEASTPGGYTFEAHCSNQTTLLLINQQPWDAVVLQEQSQLPSFPPAQVATEVYPFATRLDSLIGANDSCTETMFFMTWGRKNGDAANCPVNPPVCTYEGMQQRLRESYMEMSTANEASVSPVGEAWKRMRQFFPTIELYNADESHPSVSGSYLAACVFYCSLWHETAIGAVFPIEIPATDALKLQTVASRAVLDSLVLWQEPGTLPYAAFGVVQNGNEVQFVNRSLNAGEFYWDFGDGATSNLLNPLHLYSENGSYRVVLHSSNGCQYETAADTLTITTVGMPQAVDHRSGLLQVTPNLATGRVVVVAAQSLVSLTSTLLVADQTGRVVWQKKGLTTREVIDTGHFVPGTYLLACRSATGNITASAWMVVVK